MDASRPGAGERSLASGAARFALKTATDDLHEQLDERLATYDLSDAGEYCRFLLFHAKALPPVEDALSKGGLDCLLPGWGRQRRTALLAEDLGALGTDMPDPQAPLTFSSEAELLGAAYVLEGSRLGAAVLRREVGRGLPTAFLDPPRNSLWPALVALLDHKLDSAERISGAKSAARRCFARFLDVARGVGAE
jgi:heme oxygenase